MIQTSSILRKNWADINVEPRFREAFDELIAQCHRNLTRVDEDMLQRAFLLAYWGHRDDKRASGEPYIVHPLAVASIVAEDMRLDDLSVAAALLHDVVEDTEISLNLIREAFSPSLASIIDGLTKIQGVFDSRAVGQAENMRKLFLSMASDIRIILIKFADRLHNMRTLGALRREKQLKIASETLDLFAPLAHRFGLFNVKNEFEDLALKILEPEVYFEISRGLQIKKKERAAYIKRFIEPISAYLKDSGFDFNVYGRPKHIYSIYSKMKRQGKGLEEIYDLFAVRIILNSTGTKGNEECWLVYSAITNSYRPIPERHRDFISNPKSNGYQSLHTTVFGPDGRRVEVQIRTRAMHEIAELGVAAHWKYKEDEAQASDLDRWYAWVRDVLDSPHPDEALDFVKDFRLNLFDQEIYVFTPKGDLKTLPVKATPVDFAFQIHTEVGMHVIGAKVNGKMVPLSHPLQSGDQVEILTSQKQTPNADWLNFVVTHKAKTRIQHWINEKRRRVVEHGRQIWVKKADRAKVEVDNQRLHHLATQLNFSNTQQLFYEIGSGLFKVEDLLKLARGKTAASETEQALIEQPKLSLREQFETFIDTAQQQGQPSLIIDGERQTNIAARYASCCSPIPGDDVFGYTSRTGQLKIHRTSCRNAPHLLQTYPERIISVDWSRQKDQRFIAALRIVGEDRVGMANDITTIISKNLKTNIRSLTMETQDGVFEGTMVMDVSDVSHLRRLMERIKRVEGVYGVYRFEE